MPNFRLPWSPEARGRVRRVYLFVVTALAVYVFGLLFLPRPPAPHVQVRVGIEQQLSGRSIEQLMDEVRRWVAEDANFQRAVEAVSFEHDDAGQSTWMVQARRAIKVDRTSSEASNPLAFAIHCVIGDRGVDTTSDAVALVNHLAQQYVDDQSARHTRKAEESYRSAGASQQAAQARLDEAQNELKRFEQEVTRDRLLRLATPRVEPVPSPKPKPEPKIENVERSRQVVQNPDWAEVQQELERLRQQRETLLVRLREAHPQVMVLDDEIDQVTQRLKVTPLYVVVDVPPRVDRSDKSDDPPTPKRPAPPLPPPTEDLQEIRRIARARAPLQQEVVAARQALEGSQQQLLASQDALRRAGQEAPARITTLAAAPEPVVSNSGRSALAVLGCFALVLGGGVCVKGVRVDPTLRTVDEVERTLSLPVVGRLALDHRADAKPPVAAPPGWTRRLSRGAELFLFVFALVLIGLTVADSHFATRCWSDPVRAPSYAVHKAVHVLSGSPAEQAAPVSTKY